MANPFPVPTFFAEPKNAAQAAFIARIAERAQELMTEGYVIKQRSRKTLFGIYKPGNTTRHSDYVVDRTPGHELCTCAGFKKHGDCKHRIAVALEEAREAAQVAALEEQNRWWQEAGFDSPPLYL